MSTTARQNVESQDRIPWHQLIAYGMGGLIPIALFNIAGQLIGLLGNISLGLSAFWLGTIMIIPRLWDAFSDPIMGHLSDNTRTRWGRRRPYILVGGIAVAISFVLMWWVPRGEFVRSIFSSETAYDWFQLMYILCGLLVFFTATTIFEIPHGALGLELSDDYHERTRVFSAKSFLGNLFALGTPALFWMANWSYFRGPAGDLTDGMRYISMVIAVALIPMSFWWFFALQEPDLVGTQEQKKSSLMDDLRTTLSNGTFLNLVAIIFTLAMGFNFVALFNYYITIFYLYGGDTATAGFLLWINGMAWAITGLLAVFPLNWLSRRLGKNRTLLIAILLMCLAQLSKIFAYNPELPYLVLIPTVLLSAGMLMFFTLGSSMVGDVCDEDELKTGNRSEGSYYAVYWWVIKLGTAFASFVTGILLVYTAFDEKQNVAAEALVTNVAVVRAEANQWLSQELNSEARLAAFVKQIDVLRQNAETLRNHLSLRLEQNPDQAEHFGRLIEHADAIQSEIVALKSRSETLVQSPRNLKSETENLEQQATLLKQQTPQTLFRLRLVEIGLPLAMCLVSVLLTLRYPLTEARCYEIKAALEAGKQQAAT